MSDLIQGILIFAGVAFGAGMLFRLWWVAALIAVGGIAMFWPRGDAVSVVSFAIPVLMIAVPAFAGAAVGKFIVRRRAADPFDPQNSR